MVFALAIARTGDHNMYALLPGIQIGISCGSILSVEDKLAPSMHCVRVSYLQHTQHAIDVRALCGKRSAIESVCDALGL